MSALPKNLTALKIRMAYKKQREEEKEERLYVRWLLFVKGQGRVANLTRPEMMHLRAVKHKTYDRYLMALQQGIDTRVRRGGVYHKLKSDPAHPMSFKTYCHRWWVTAKGTYRKCDVPALMKLRWEQLHANRDTEVRQQREGQWMSALRREITERDGGSLGVPVPDLQTPPGSLEGRHPGPQPLRGATKKTPAILGDE